MAQVKLCIRCEEKKPVDKFCRDRSRRDGLHPYCTPCKSAPYLVRDGPRQARRDAIAARTEKGCSKCGEVKRLSEFYSKRSALDGRTSRCSECLKEDGQKRNRISPEKARAYYQRSKRERSERTKLIRRENKSFLIKMLGGKCAGCGIRPGDEWPLACFDFHHTSRDKENSIAGHLLRVDQTPVMKEAKKCIVFCASCHRRHHWNENNSSI